MAACAFVYTSSMSSEPIPSARYVANCFLKLSQACEQRSQTKISQAYRSSSSSSRLSMYSETWPPKMYFLRTSASSSLDSGSNPGKRLSEWGMKIPPSLAPFIAPNTRDPVDVRLSPTSRKHLNGRGASSSSRTSVSFKVPSGSVTPSYLSASPSLVRARLATSRPVA